MNVCKYVFYTIYIILNYLPALYKARTACTVRLLIENISFSSSSSLAFDKSLLLLLFSNILLPPRILLNASIGLLPICISYYLYYKYILFIKVFKINI